MNEKSEGIALPIKDPIPDAAIGLIGRILSLAPIDLDLVDQAVFVLLCSILGLVAFRGQVVLNLLVVPIVVGIDGVVIPVVLDQVLEIFPV